MKKLLLSLAAVLGLGMSANAADWYLVGANYGWSDNEAYGFAANGDGTYSLSVASLSGEFKIKENGTWNTSFGSNGSKLVEGQVYYAEVDKGNITIDGKIQNANITINPGDYSILVTGRTAENDYDVVYVVGDFGDGDGWSETRTDFPLTLQNGAWVGEVKTTKAISYIKLKAGDNVYGADDAEDQPLPVNQGYPLTVTLGGGKAFTIGSGEWTFSLSLEKNAETGLLMVTGTATEPEEPDQPEDPIEGDYVAYFDNTNSGWENVYAYAYQNDGEVKNANWPGVKLEANEDGLYVAKFTFEPEIVIFNNNAGSQTDNLEFVQENIYSMPVVIWGNFTAYWDNTDAGWEEVYCYAYANDGTTKNENWPGVKLEANEEGLYVANINFQPDIVIFNNGKDSENGGLQSDNLEFEDGKVYGRPEGEGVKGDLNGDEKVNVSDITELVNVILGEAENPAADVNGDGKVNVADLTELINIMLN